MIDATEIWQYLEDHADELLQSNEVLLRELDRLRYSASITMGREAEDLRSDLEWPSGKHGAYPSSEWSPGSDSWLPFSAELSPEASRREWSHWAEQALNGVTTLAVDGSQIYPSSDWSIPVAAVQVGMFENPHLGIGDYKRSAKFEPISPLDLLGNESDDVALQDAVNERRHRLEIETLIDWMRSHSGEPGRRVALFDGTLVVSFATNLRPRYVESVLDLVEASEATQTPVVGYLDSSRARDLSQMYSWLDSESPTRLIDGVFLPESRWLQRTPAFVCARAKGLENYDRRGRQTDIYFSYLRSSRDSLPARLEFPGWILRSEKLEQVVDTIRAEIVAQGGGYPYAFETADAIAVLTARDRDRFRDVFRRFAEQRFSVRSPFRARSRPKIRSKIWRR
jgi:hypothetical protein